MDSHGPPRRLGFGQQALQEAAADSPPAEFRQECDVDDPNLVGAASYVQAADRLDPRLDDEKIGVREVFPVVDVLRVKLLTQKGLFCGCVPGDLRQFSITRRGVHAEKKPDIVVNRWSQI